jgi:predicted RNase H-like HicB family nuclease
LKVRVIFHPCEEGGYWVEVPGFPGCVSEGDTLEEARNMIKEAFECFTESMQTDAVLHPEDQTPGDIIEEMDLRPERIVAA